VSGTARRSLRVVPSHADDREGTHRLPVLIEPLVGRAAELARVRELLRAGRRLVTVTGLGGIGKTRVAAAVAHGAADDLDATVLWVSLAPLAAADVVMPTIATAAEVEPSPVGSARDALIDAFADRRMLLVLDNVEHVRDAAADLVELLGACGGLQLLTTSRVPLGVPGEVEVEIEPLDDGDAMELFVRAVRRFDPDFAVDASNSASLAAICRRVEGRPLALELAAARLRLLAPADLAARLGESFDVLRSPSRRGLPHHRTLHATIEWSYRLLAADEQFVLRRLSAFSGGFTLAAAAAVCDLDPLDALDRLDALVAHHLVRVLPASEGERRFDLFDAIREFAAGELEAAGDAESAHAAHIRWVAGLVDAAAADLIGPGAPAALAALTRELENVRIALDRCSAAPTGSAAGLLIAAPLWRYWLRTGNLGEGRARTERVIAAYAGAADLALARSLLAAGDLAAEQSDLVAAERWTRRAAETFEAVGDELGVADTWNSLGMVRRANGELRRAEQLHRDAMEVFERLGERRRAVSALNGLASIAYFTGDLSAAEEHWRATLSHARELGDRQATGLVLNNLGAVRLRVGDAAEARALHAEALEVAREVGDAHGEAAALSNLGEALLVLGAYDDASVMLADGLERVRQLGLRESEGVTLHTLGCLARATGEAREAARRWIESMTIFAEVGATPGVAQSIESLAGLAVAIGRPDDAASLLGWCAASREHDGSSPERDRTFGHDVAVLHATLDESARRELEAIGRAWSFDDVRAAAESIASAAPQRVAARDRAAEARHTAARRWGLTARELDVLDRLVERRTDREIAGELYVSVRTVTTHVSAILRKLGVRSRREVAARAGELGLSPPP